MRLRPLRPWRSFAARGELYLHGFRPLSRPPRSGGFESGFRPLEEWISPFWGKNSADLNIALKRFLRSLTLSGIVIFYKEG